MTTTHAETSRNDVRAPATVAEAADAWLVAMTKGDEAQRQLELPDAGLGLDGGSHGRVVTEKTLAFMDVPDRAVDDHAETTCRSGADGPS